MTPTTFTKTQTIFLLLIALLSATTYAITVQDLIDSYSFDYNNGTINITTYADSMVDKNSNSVNDTLILDLTTTATSGTYSIFAEISDSGNIITNSTTETFSGGDSVATITFSTALLSQDRFNYSVTIYNNEGIEIFRKYRIQSGQYSAYEKGTNITAISDSNINNNYLRINLTINSTVSATKNITVVLKYNDSTITATKAQSLSSGIQTVAVDFGNETVKSTQTLKTLGA